MCLCKGVGFHSEPIYEHGKYHQCQVLYQQQTKAIQYLELLILLEPSWKILLIIIIIYIMYLYSAQYLHILQDSKRYLTNPTVQVQPQLTSN